MLVFLAVYIMNLDVKFNTSDSNSKSDSNFHEFVEEKETSKSFKVDELRTVSPAMAPCPHKVWAL